MIKNLVNTLTVVFLFVFVFVLLLLIPLSQLFRTCKINNSLANPLLVNKNKESLPIIERRKAMGKHSNSIPFQKNKKRWPLMSLLLLLFFSLSTAIVFFVRSSSDPSDIPLEKNQIRVADRVGERIANPLGFMKSKLVLLVSHELSLSGK